MCVYSPSRSRINDQTITRDPQRVQTPQLTRPFDESGDTPLSQPSMWQASADLGGDDHKREAVKSQLESITGRMFAVSRVPHVYTHVHMFAVSCVPHVCTHI